eukprot:scaffold50544_cov52-Phaeocystis_antarctica.AAC.3
MPLQRRSADPVLTSCVLCQSNYGLTLTLTLALALTLTRTTTAWPSPASASSTTYPLPPSPRCRPCSHTPTRAAGYVETTPTMAGQSRPSLKWLIGRGWPKLGVACRPACSAAESRLQRASWPRSEPPCYRHRQPALLAARAHGRRQRCDAVEPREHRTRWPERCG